MTRLAPLLALLVLLVGCSDPRKALDDDAACPGSTCTDDVQERLDALAALDRVTGVDRVERTYGLDRGSARSATLRARVADRTAARDVALQALTVLDDWPEHQDGSVTVTVTADPVVTVPYVGTSELDMSRPPFEPCSGADCAAAIEQVRDRTAEDYDDVANLRFDIAAGTLRVTATTAPEQVELVARNIQASLIEVGTRIADRAEVQVRGRGPLSLTLRLDEGLVCEQPLGTRATCDEDNSVPLGP